MYIPQSFAQKSRQKLFAVWTVVSGRGSDAPCGEGSQTGDGNTGGTNGRSPQNVKTAAPETQQMMGAENIKHRRKHERIFF
uniref:Uncharacterized protein n=1 Tax=Escherichia coli TaxID=562 RepID=A0A6N0ISK7_ECOLX|nr:hypothetical protein [Escherichia coli]QKQ37727.1 hypothetical protein HPE44_25355 [Escherichia coli]